jgi:ABC-type uncharacterized transport system YnjBCD ATPase subunit
MHLLETTLFTGKYLKLNKKSLSALPKDKTKSGILLHPRQVFDLLSPDRTGTPAVSGLFIQLEIL